VIIGEVNLKTQSDTRRALNKRMSSSTICGYPPRCGPSGCRRRKYSLSRHIAHAPPSRSSGEHIFDLLGPVSLPAGGNTLAKNDVHLDRRTWQYLPLFFCLPPRLSSHRLNGPLPSSVCPPSIAVKLSHRRPSCSISITDDYILHSSHQPLSAFNGNAPGILHSTTLSNNLKMHPIVLAAAAEVNAALLSYHTSTWNGGDMATLEGDVAGMLRTALLLGTIYVFWLGIW
jgi:hypothetical protein